MKKLIALALVLGLCVAGVVAQPTVSGEIGATYRFEDDDGYKATIEKVGLKVAIPVGDVVTVNMFFKNQGTGEATYEIFDEVFAVTNVSKAFGIDAVNLTLTGGKFNAWMAGFGNVATFQHRERLVDFEAGVTPVGNQPAGLMLTVGVPKAVNICVYLGSPAVGEVSYKFGVSLAPDAVAGLSFNASYAGTTQAASDYFRADAGYALAIGEGMKLFVPVQLFYDITDEEFGFGTGLKFTGMGLTAAVGLGTKDAETNALQVLDANLAYDINKIFSLYANGYMDVREGAVDFIEAVDLGAKVAVGKNSVYIGYMIDVGADTDINMGTTDKLGKIEGGGFYLAWYVAF